MAGSISDILAQITQIAQGVGANIDASTAYDPAQQSADQLAAIMRQIQQTATAGTGGRRSQWYDSVFEHYLGRIPNAQDDATMAKGGWNYDRLVDHLRAQPSYIKGMTIGAVEDAHTSANPSFMKWTGKQATDADIQQLANLGLTSAQDIEKHITNRADVVAAHPGAPLGLGDVQWGQHKAAIDSQYMQNGLAPATDQQARDAFAQAASPFRKAPPEQIGLSSGIQTQPSGALISQAQIAPNARV